MTSTTLADTLGSIATTVGGSLVGAVTTAIPVIVPFAALLFAIRYVVGKIGLKA